MLRFSKVLIALLGILIIAAQTKAYALTIVLDPGHGGIDSGAVNGDIYESDVALKIAKYVKEYLQEYKDVTVTLTHEEIKSGELTVFDRAIMARDKNADLLVSLHINSSTDKNVNGAEVYVSANKSLDKYNKETSELGNKILEGLNKLGVESRGVKTRVLSTDTTDRYSDGTMADYYGIIRYAMRGTKIDLGVIKPEGKESANIQNGEGVPAILVEHCFISSNKDLTYINSEEGIQKLAKADAEAIAVHYGLKTDTEKVTNVKLEDDGVSIRVAPKAMIEELTKYLNVTSYSILDSKGNRLDKSNEKIATGYKVKTDDKEYTIIKMGDVDGDGKVLATDSLAILKHTVHNKELEGVYLKAADVNKDGKVLATDALNILKHSIGKIIIDL